MGQMQGIQGHQAIQTLNNDIYDSAGSNSSSSYVSTSGIKSVLLHAWNAVKSAVSGMLSSFGVHLSGQQGSDKLGRKIVMDVLSRPLPPIPEDDDGGHYAQVTFDAVPQGSTELKDESIGEAIYATVSKSTVAQKGVNYWKEWGVEDATTMSDSTEYTETADTPPPVPGYTDRTPLYT
ncbi:TPA: hypothetical protein ACWL6U_003462 [Morganella morganii]